MSSAFGFQRKVFSPLAANFACIPSMTNSFTSHTQVRRFCEWQILIPTPSRALHLLQPRCLDYTQQYSKDQPALSKQLSAAFSPDLLDALPRGALGPSIQSEYLAVSSCPPLHWPSFSRQVSQPRAAASCSGFPSTGKRQQTSASVPLDGLQRASAATSSCTDIPSAVRPYSRPQQLLPAALTFLRRSNFSGNFSSYPQLHPADFADSALCTPFPQGGGM